MIDETKAALTALADLLRAPVFICANPHDFDRADDWMTQHGVKRRSLDFYLFDHLHGGGGTVFVIDDPNHALLFRLWAGDEIIGPMIYSPGCDMPDRNI